MEPKFALRELQILIQQASLGLELVRVPELQMVLMQPVPLMSEPKLDHPMLLPPPALAPMVLLPPPVPVPMVLIMPTPGA